MIIVKIELLEIIFDGKPVDNGRENTFHFYYITGRISLDQEQSGKLLEKLHNWIINLF